MKKLFFVAAMSTMFIASLAFSSASLNKAHKGKTKDGAKITCAYCHKTAAMPKETKDYKKHQKNKFCAGSGCH